MSILMSESTRLAGPSDSLVIEPAFAYDVDSPWAAELPEMPEDPSFLRQARELAAEFAASPMAHARLAQAALGAGLLTEAHVASMRAFAASESSDKPDASAVMGSAQVLLAIGSLADAQIGLEKLPATVPQTLLLARIAVRTNRYADALNLLDGLHSREAADTRGWLFLELRRYTDAIHALREVMRDYGPSATALSNLGYAYAATGALPKAISVTRQAQELDPFSQRIAFNLVSYYRAAGNDDRALAEVRRLQGDQSTDLRLVFLEADIRAAGGDLEGAERALRRARTAQMWIDAELLERSELEANLAFIRWRLGRLDREAARAEIVNQLRRTEFKSLEIARMLFPFFRSSDEMDELNELLSSLVERHPDEPFHQLRVYLALRRGKFEEGMALALEWARETVFDPDAAGTAVFMLADIAGNYAEALEIGLPAVRRHPSSAPLVNNVAYTLALLGRYSEALRLLDDVGDSIHLTATRALVDYLRGDSESGRAGFARARELAERRAHTDDELPKLVDYHQIVAIFRAARRGALKGVDPATVHLPFPTEWSDDPSLVLMKAIADREGIRVDVAPNT
jgi:tetratricopeptide (TPR) repeat protein